MSPKAPPTVPVGDPVELARYVIDGVERMLCGQWIGGDVQVTDRPCTGQGRVYFVESCNQRDGYAAVEALIADYTSQARRLKEIPMVAGVMRHIEQVELARYRFTGGQRVLYGQRVDDVVRVTDRPADGPGRSYLVELGLERDGFGGLATLVADYTRQAGRRDEIPMAATRARRAGRRALEQDPV